MYAAGYLRQRYHSVSIRGQSKRRGVSSSRNFTPTSRICSQISSAVQNHIDSRTLHHHYHAANMLSIEKSLNMSARDDPSSNTLFRSLQNLQVPEHLKDDMTNRYCRTRFSDREHSAAFWDVHHPWLKRELAKVTLLRQDFFDDIDNREICQLYTSARDDWRYYKGSGPRIGLGEGSRNIPRERNLDSGSIRQRVQSGSANGHKRDNQKGSHSKSYSSSRPGIRAEKDDHAFEVTEIKLKRKSASESSFDSATLEKYSLNDALYHKEINPLRQMRDERKVQELRFFHFPANSRKWVEVCLPSMVIYKNYMRSLISK